MKETRIVEMHGRIKVLKELSEYVKKHNQYANSNVDFSWIDDKIMELDSQIGNLNKTNNDEVIRHSRFEDCDPRGCARHSMFQDDMGEE